MSSGDWVALIGCLITTLAAFYAGVRFLVKSIMRELLPNGGGGLRDEIRTLSGRVDQIYLIISKKD